MTLDNIRIGKKLALGFGFVVLAAVILGGAGLFGISRISGDLAEIGEMRVPDLRILTKLNALRTPSRFPRDRPRCGIFRGASRHRG